MVDHRLQAGIAGPRTDAYMVKTGDVTTCPIFRFDELCAEMNADMAGNPGQLQAFKAQLPGIYRQNIAIIDNKYLYRPSTTRNMRLPRIIERGTYKTPGNNDPVLNAGRLGKLDLPDNCDRIWGTAGGQFMDSTVV